MDSQAAKALKKTVAVDLSNDFMSTDSEYGACVKSDELAKYSLIVNDHPETAYKLMLYIKHYSELLFAWGETYKSIEYCKIASRAFRLLKIYNPTYFTKPEQQSRIHRQDIYGNLLQVQERALEFEDSLLFSEYSLNYQLTEEIGKKIRKVKTT